VLPRLAVVGNKGLGQDKGTRADDDVGRIIDDDEDISCAYLALQVRCGAFGHSSLHFPDIVAWRPEALRPRVRPPLGLYEVIASDKCLGRTSKACLIDLAGHRETWPSRPLLPIFSGGVSRRRLKI
jgi:hypothetical protein